jgi:hypothetical protein
MSGEEAWAAAAAAIQARWDHGHDELTDGCSLRHAEYAEAMRWTQKHPST